MGDLDPAGAAVFLAAICATIALACSKPEHWGYRRLSMGAGACFASVAAILLAPSPWWYAGPLWGLHQMFRGWSFISRRQGATPEGIE